MRRGTVSKAESSESHTKADSSESNSREEVGPELLPFDMQEADGVLTPTKRITSSQSMTSLSGATSRTQLPKSGTSLYRLFWLDRNERMLLRGKTWWKMRVAFVLPQWVSYKRSSKTAASAFEHKVSHAKRGVRLDTTNLVKPSFTLFYLFPFTLYLT